MNVGCMLIITACKFSYYFLNDLWMQYTFAVVFAIGMGNLTSF